MDSLQTLLLPQLYGATNLSALGTFPGLQRLAAACEDSEDLLRFVLQNPNLVDLRTGGLGRDQWSEVCKSLTKIRRLEAGWLTDPSVLSGLSSLREVALTLESSALAGLVELEQIERLRLNLYGRMRDSLRLPPGLTELSLDLLECTNPEVGSALSQVSEVEGLRRLSLSAPVKATALTNLRSDSLEHLSLYLPSASSVEAVLEHLPSLSSMEVELSPETNLDRLFTRLQRLRPELVLSLKVADHAVL